MTAQRRNRQSFLASLTLPPFALLALVVGFVPQPSGWREPSTLGAAPSAAPPEEEEAKPKPAKKIAVEEKGAAEDALGKKAAGRAVPLPVCSPDVRLDEVALAHEAASAPATRAFLGRFVVPFDLLTETGRAPIRIRPVPLHFATERFPDRFGVVEMDDRNASLPDRVGTTKSLQKLDAFEEIALADAERYLKETAPADGPGRGARLAAAEAVLGGVLRFHDWARDRNKRLGKGWTKVRAPLYDRLREVRLERFKLAASERDTALLSELTGRLVALYSKDPATMLEVSSLRLREAEGLLRDGTPADLERLKDILSDFESKYPAGAREIAVRIRREMSARAAKFFDESRREDARKNPAAARNLLRAAEALDPDLPGLRDYRSQLKGGYPVLAVGVSRLPVLASPAAARFDCERYASELLFESLYEEISDGRGGRTYFPELAAGPPATFGGGREIALARGVEWGTSNGEALRAHDVEGTLKLFRAHPETWSATSAEWWGEQSGLDAPDRIRLALRRGHPDPRAALTFKVLPARWLADRGKSPGDPEFARRPTGTGPFRFLGALPRQAGGPAEAAFSENPSYGRRPGKLGQPTLREIRFVELPTVADPIAEMKGGRLHVLPDVSTADLDRYLNPGTGLAKAFEAYTYSDHRRVHLLAANHRRPSLQSRDLRRGLSLLLDREAVLDEVFRAGKPNLHAAMAGPFPPRSWASPKGLDGRPVPSKKYDLALVKLNAYLSSGGRAELSLVYPDDDPLAPAACEAIKRQVERAFKDAPSGRALALVLKGLAPADFHRTVREEHAFDLAYANFDYPDEWFHLGLGSFLDPSACRPGGRNYLGYLAPGTSPDVADSSLRAKLAEAREHRDVAGELLPRVREIGELFNEAVPFIPLWQLDRHAIFAGGVKVVLPNSPESVSPQLLDPLRLFQGTGRWRLE